MVGICRLCATLRKKEHLTTITDEKSDLCQQVQICCQVHIRIEDSLPKSVCNECIKALHSAHTFRLKVQESQEALQSLFPTLNNIGKCEINLIGTLSELTIMPSQQRNTVQKPENETEKQIKEEKSSNKEAEIEAEILEAVVGVDEEVAELEDVVCTTPVEQIASTNENLEIEAFVKNTARNAEMNLSNSNSSKYKYSEPLSEEVEMLDETEEEEDENDEPFVVANVNDSNNIKMLAVSGNALADWRAYEWRCSLCSHKTSSFNTLQQHAMQAHGTDPTSLHYKCTDCQKVCMHYHNFLNHVRLRHHPGLALRCDVCNEQFSDYAKLAAHRHFKCNGAGNRPQAVLCSVCGKSFRNRGAAQTHTRMQHVKTNKGHSCETCGRRFTHAGALRAHQTVHSDVKQYSCDMCGRGFRRKVNLESHLYSHVNARPFECNICKKSFKCSTHLEKHLEVHNNVKLYKCDHCDNCFRTKDAKLTHERIHTGELPFQCLFCQKRFRFRSTHATHLNTHTGKRPYSCDNCERTFTNWPNYNKHSKRCAVGARSGTSKSHSRASPKTSHKSRSSNGAEKVHMVSFVYDEDNEIGLTTDEEDNNVYQDYIEIIEQDNAEASNLPKIICET